MIARAWDRYLEHIRSASFRGIEAWVRADRAQWLVEMCDLVGVSAPPDPESFALSTGAWVSERVRADIPGAIDTVKWLAGRGLRLHMASGGLSWELDPYLRGMGIRDRFNRLYGPDLIDAAKSGVHYYAGILSDSETDPSTAVAVEDSAEARGWAEQQGLRTFASLADLRAALA